MYILTCHTYKKGNSLNGSLLNIGVFSSFDHTDYYINRLFILSNFEIETRGQTGVIDNVSVKEIISSGVNINKVIMN